MPFIPSLPYAALGIAFLIATSVDTSAANIQQGQRLASLYCASCHATDRVSQSPLSIAPPFRDLHKKYPVDTLEEALGEGIMTGHPTMPQFQFDPDQIADFLAFLKTLE